MKALAIDCVKSKFSVAAKNDKNLVKLTLDAGLKQSEKLLPTIDLVIKEIGILPSELDYTTLTSGPGGFTSLRLAFSALKALSLSDNIPIYGVPSLDAYAWPYRKASETVLSVLEASREDEYFFSFYVKGEKIRSEEESEIEEILKEIDIESSVLVCGPSSKKFCERVREVTPLYTFTFFSPENDATESLFEIAENMIIEKKESLKDSDGPLYFRKSEAELVLEKEKK